MMLAITGGKGGTGKSTVATSIAYALSEKKKVLLVDADVDCPNDHLLLNIERSLLRTVEQRIPVFDMEKCTKCGECGKACKTNAIVSIKGKAPIFIESQCNGCGACRIVCPAEAIEWGSKELGKIYTGKKGGLSLLSGELNTNQPMSESIVSRLNEEIEKVRDRFDIIIIDTAAGTHCPVIAALENADVVLAVTEPTSLGSHDLEIILKILSGMKKKSRIIINRSDMGDDSKIAVLSEKYSSEIISRIPYSEEIVRAYSDGKPIIIKNILEAIAAKDDKE